MTNVGIVGITGYTGLELFRLLDQHPNVRVRRVYGRQHVGERLSRVFPHLVSDLLVDSLSDETIQDVEFVFLCLPHGEGQEMARQLLDAGKRVIDLSADFRLKDLDLFKQAYHADHREPELLQRAIYGVPELFSDSIKTADLLANPGCYATSVILPLFPIVPILSSHAHVLVDAKSGVSGAGRAASQAKLFSEINESFSAYNTFLHRHQVEIESVVGRKIIFSTHLIPMNRGILSSIYLIGAGVSRDAIVDQLNQVYFDSPFVTVNPNWETPGTREVAGSNRAMIGVKQDPNQDCIAVFCAIDNLIKGASGQAIQNLNIMAGYSSTVGLPIQGGFV